MTPFEPTQAALDALFNAKEVSLQYLRDLQQHTNNERFSVRGQITQVSYNNKSMYVFSMFILVFSCALLQMSGRQLYITYLV